MRTEEKMTLLINQRDRYFASMQSCYDLAKKCQTVLQAVDSVTTDSAFVDLFTARMGAIERTYECYERSLNSIEEINVLLEEPADKIDTLQPMQSFEELYFFCQSVHTKLKDGLRASAPLPEPTQTKGSDISQVKLPRIQIPPFDGKLENWTTFHSLYSSLVHTNNRYSPCEKFHFLLTLLTKEPLDIIRNLKISEANYYLAWDAIEKRYQNVRLLATHYVDSMLNFPPFNECSIPNLSNFLKVFKTNVAAIGALNLKKIDDLLILHLALRVLDPATRTAFEREVSEKSMPATADLVNFIEDQYKILEITKSPQNPKSSSHNRSQSKPKPKQWISTITTIDNRACPACHTNDPNHRLYECDAFKALSISARQLLVKNSGKCPNCLGNHSKHLCKSTMKCRHCGYPHHSYLHNNSPHSNFSPAAHKSRAQGNQKSERFPTNNSNSSPDSKGAVASTSDIHNYVCPRTESSSHSVMLSTAVASCLDSQNAPQPIRILIDPGAQKQLVTKSFVKGLGLPISKQCHAMKSAGGPFSTNEVAHFTLLPSHAAEPSFDVVACVVDEITDYQPQIPIDPSIKKSFSHLTLADPNFDQPGPVDFLLGAELYPWIVDDTYKNVKGYPAALPTHFGWIVMGKAPVQLPPLTSLSLLITSCDPLETALKKFWEIEEVSISTPICEEDKTCENFFAKTHYRTSTGRYVVKLPFKNPPPALPNNRNLTLKRFWNLETRLSRQPELHKAYHDFMQEYISLNHMYPAPVSADYVIPHHIVLKLDSSTTKLRTVFDASFSPFKDAPSLNSLLMSGPNLQRDLSEIITAFRLYAITLCSDIQQMFRQILVHPDDRKCQHIFYRDSLSSEVVEYELATVTYGQKASTYLSKRVLLQLVADEGASFPLASEAIKNTTYIDDFCCGSSDVASALKLRQEMIELLALGGFNLRKWSSNTPEVLEGIPSDCISGHLSFSPSEDNAYKVLGILYNPLKDVFAYSVSVQPIRPTKRGVLSELSKIFDPLGWLTPLTLVAKCIMQALWQCGVQWDDYLPNHIADSWNRFTEGLPLLGSIAIPRYIPSRQSSDSKIFGFCDGSNRGYAAVIYITTTVNGTISSHLIKSKSKVAPLKTLSVPRIELSGAFLLAKLLDSLQFFVKDVNPSGIYLFSDSTIVLAWLRTSPHLLKTFVANRVVSILEHTSPQQWHHVKSAENPADPASRGLFPEDLTKCELWWKGPEFIRRPLNISPIPPFSEGDDFSSELKKISPSVFVTSAQLKPFIETIAHFSSLEKAKRVFGYVLRFIHNKFCSIDERWTGSLTPHELKRATNCLIKITQLFYYNRDLSLLKNEEPPDSPELKSLTPFIDSSGIMRVGGRIDKAPVSYNVRHPIIIPHKSHLAILICDFYHKYSIHGGLRLVSSLVQRNFWIPSIRKLIRQRIHLCIKCYLPKAKPHTPQMAELPAVRLQNLRPFLKVALDFCGPFQMKVSNRRNAALSKGYLAVFVCLEVKAVHLELAPDLTSDTFLRVLDRFIARRGICQEIWSDRGTTFIGASRQLREVQEMLSQSHGLIQDHLSSREIAWHFFPPTAAHMNGIAESHVKLTKHHLLKVIGGQTFTYEELNTIIIRIEAILNSRPIGVVSVDPTNTDYLTPGHFIIGAPLLSPPEEDLTDTPLSRLSRHQLIQQCLQSFWKRWVSEYLPTLVPRNKWAEAQRNLKVGEVVFIRNEKTDPLQWPIARIEEVMLGQDGVARVARVRTSAGTYVRPVHCLVTLPQI